MNTSYNPQVITNNQSLFQRVFGWMFAGLLLTGIVAYVLSQNPNVIQTLNNGAIWIIIGAEFLLVLALSSLINKISASLATILFFVYAALTGVSLTLFLSYFSIGTVYTAFFLSAGIFGMFAAYGYITKKDLSKIGSIALMLFLGVILATFVNFFLQNSFMQLIISYVVVGLTCIITAFDIQNIKNLSNEAMDDEQASKMAIFGALMLYLDFILIFKNILYILGDD